LSGKNIKHFIIIAVVILGALISFTSVKAERRLIDSDEAAWLFNGYYFDLYVSGDWGNPAWTEFDKYANHPPATSYLFGAMLHAIGEPMKSIEPRRFWFENDLSIINSPQVFHDNLARRLTFKQVMAGRYMSAFFGWLTAIALMFLAFRLVGVFGGVAGFFLLLFHPTFRGVMTLAVGDTFIMFISVLSVLLAVEMVRREKFLWLAVFLAPVLGVAIASKISCFVLLVPVLIPLFFLRGDDVPFRKALSILVLTVILSLCMAYVLDPGLHGSPLRSTFERFAWRLDRVEIQQIVFADQKLVSIISRLAFAARYLFFSNVFSFLFFLLYIGGLVFFFIREKERYVFFLFVNVVYFSFLTIFFLPMGWTRYVMAWLPFLMLSACLGAERFKDTVFEWSSLRRVGRVATVGGTLAAVIVAAALGWFLSPRERHMPPFATGEERRIARMFAESLMRPGVDVDIHQQLLEYFERIGNHKRAAEQRQKLEKMGVE